MSLIDPKTLEIRSGVDIPHKRFRGKHGEAWYELALRMRRGDCVQGLDRGAALTLIRALNKTYASEGDCGLMRSTSKNADGSLSFSVWRVPKNNV